MTTEFFVPNLGESITEATLARWMHKIGDHVTENQPLCELETDKIAVEVPAPCSGKLVSLTAAEGDVVEPGAALGAINAAAAAEEPQAAPEPPPAATEDAAHDDPKTAAAVLSPAVRHLITEHHLDPNSLHGSGKDGRLLKSDILDAIAAKEISASTQIEPAAAPPPATAPPPAAIMTSPSPPPQSSQDSTKIQRVPMTRLRRTIASRLKQAQQEAALLTTFNDVDLSAIIALRSQWRDHFAEKHGTRLGFMGFFVKAAVKALKAVPGVNAKIDGDDILYHQDYHIGVAVAVECGLVVPIIRDADRLSIAEIERAIADSTERARNGTLTLDDMRGGTFSISNGGVFGSLLSTPIVNWPQSAILGLHRIEDRPVARDGAVIIRPMMYLALSYDHRLIDGREAVRFLVTIKEAIEDPNRLFLDL